MLDKTGAQGIRAALYGGRLRRPGDPRPAVWPVIGENRSGPGGLHIQGPRAADFCGPKDVLLMGQLLWYNGPKATGRTHTGDTTMKDQDFGFYGKGAAGYAHYKQDFDRIHGGGPLENPGASRGRHKRPRANKGGARRAGRPDKRPTGRGGPAGSSPGGGPQETPAPPGGVTKDPGQQKGGACRAGKAWQAPLVLCWIGFCRWISPVPGRRCTAGSRCPSGRSAGRGCPAR